MCGIFPQLTFTCAINVVSKLQYASLCNRETWFCSSTFHHVMKSTYLQNMIFSEKRPRLWLNLLNPVAFSECFMNLKGKGIHKNFQKINGFQLREITQWITVPSCLCVVFARRKCLKLATIVPACGTIGMI